MRLLFVCVGNSCRSQIAEGIANKMGFEAFSAGTNPASHVNPNAVKILKNLDIETSKLFPKSIEDFKNEKFDLTISMGCGVSCPSIKIDQDWELEDPVGKNLKYFEKITKKIVKKLKKIKF
tara:strand:+ start:4464 stop:4826 length:363 start_codon:yes stop_codon:yes gene_type:complete